MVATQVDSLPSPGDLKVTVREMPGQTVVELSGELDLATVATLREALVVLDLDSGLHMEVDLSSLSFLGSTGVSLIVMACKRVRASGGTFSTTCGHNLARRVLEVSGLLDFLELHDGEEPHPNQRGVSWSR